MKIDKHTLNIGAEHPFKVTHITDSHLTFVDHRDDDRKIKLACERKTAFEKNPGDCQKFFESALQYCKENSDFMVHTGDLIDFVSYKNIDYMAEKLSEVDYIFATGNHEYSLYVGEAIEDNTYRMQSYDRIQGIVKNSIDFDSKIYNGINFIALYNGYYLFYQKQLEQLRYEVAKGYPIVLLMHNPIHTDELYNEMIVTRQKECSFLVGTPEEMMKGWAKNRREQQKADDVTLEIIAYIKNQPLIKAIITGHLHFSYKTMLTESLPQYITGGNYYNIAAEFEFR